MLRVLFDSSFLMALIEHPTTWYEDMTEKVGKFEPVLPDCVGNELKRLASTKRRRARGASLALELARTFTKSKCSADTADRELVERARDPETLVATVDKEILRGVKLSGRKAVTLHRGRIALA